MTENFILPLLVLLPMVFAAAAWLIYNKSKDSAGYLTVIAAAAEAAAVIYLCLTGGLGAEFRAENLCLMGISFKLTGFGMVYCVLTSFAWLTTALFSKEYMSHSTNCGRYWFFNLTTLGASMGIFLAADLYTTFIFFEIMSLTSFVMVVHEETEKAISAANTYLAVAIIGGLASLMGLFLLQYSLGTLGIDEIYGAVQAYTAAGGSNGVLYTAGSCLLFGFGAKAGMFPIHSWLPRAYTAAPAPATALLSSILSKTGVLGIIVISCNVFRYDPKWGAAVLTLGTITMVLGAVLALLSANLKRTIAYSSMSQIGFILVGISMIGFLGEESALAARGVILHMVNHSLFKLLLFMIAGVVYMDLHKLDLNDIRGFGRGKPLLNAAYLTGALGIAGVPLLSGYVSKTLLHESIVEYIEILRGSGASVLGFQLIEWLFLLSGGITLAYMIKLYVVLFVEKPLKAHHHKPDGARYMGILSTFAICAVAVAFPVMGLFPGFSMDKISDLAAPFLSGGELSHAVHYFTLKNFSGAGISIALGTLIYFFIVRKLLIRKDAAGNRIYVNLMAEKQDLEYVFYRPLFLKWLPEIFGRLMAVFAENRLLRIIFGKAANEKINAVPGETRALKPMSMGVFGIADNIACLLAEPETSRIMRPLGIGIIGLLDTVSCFFSDSLDAGILLLRKTAFRELRLKADDEGEHIIAARAGALFDGIWKNGYKGKSYREVFINADMTAHRMSRRIKRNLSFALLMSTIGVCAFFIYLMFTYM